MLGSAKVRAARKAAQKARLKKKGSKDYPEFYAKQPQQLVKAAAQAKIQIKKQELNEAIETLQVAEITGEGLLVAQEAAQIARLVVNKLEDAERPSTQIQLTAAGAK